MSSVLYAFAIFNFSIYYRKFHILYYSNAIKRNGFLFTTPENSVFKKVNDKTLFGFHRLAINGYSNPESEQPIELEDCVLICNGEIYNWKYLHRSLKIPTKTGSDCEIIIHLYKKFGIEYTVNILDGVFAFLLLRVKYMI